MLSACANNQADNQIEYVENQKITLSFSFGKRTGMYTGHLKNDVPDGIGKFISENTSGDKWTYIGEWNDGHFDGHGTNWFDNGNISSCTYNNDVASGFGLSLYNDTVYYGNMENDKSSGNGTFLSLSGNYNGEFSNGLFEGQGTLYYTNGNKFEGTFKNNLVNGSGTLFFPNGEKVIGTFSTNESEFNGTGKFYSEDGKSSECSIINGKLHISNSDKASANSKPSPEASKNKTDSSTKSRTTYTLKYGKLLDSNPKGDSDGKTLVIKAKIESNLTNRLTILQNFNNVADIIKNQGGKNFNSIDYWAVADMSGGSEEKVISFSLSKDIIKKIYSGKILDNQIEHYANDLFIHQSLQ